jgi:hypothetical protein
MPRTVYHRKRHGYRAYIASLWQALRPFTQPASNDPARTDTSGLQSDGLTPEQIDEMRAILAELGEQFRIGLNVGELPEAPPDFFAIGAEMPASRFTRTSIRLQHHLKPRGRPRKAAVRPLRPQQVDVDRWMLGRAGFASARGEPALKEALAVRECMVAMNASRSQARVAFCHLPPALRRQRGQHDRWATHRAPDPDP